MSAGHRHLRGKQFTDSEVQKFGYAFIRHKDVGGLEIAVNYQMLVRVTDGSTDAAEEAQPFVNRKAVRVAVFVNGVAFDIFHDEEREVVGGCAAVEEARDVRMV